MPILATPTELVPAFFSLPAGSEYLVILIVALLLFGKRLPEIMRGLGSSVREFKKGMDTDDRPLANREPVQRVDGAVSRGELPPPGAPAEAQHPPKQH